MILGGFNLLPAFPMDGGRVLRAYLAGRMSYVKATRLAANIGKQLAIIMAILGIFYNIFLVLIAIFIYIGAEQEYRSIMVSTLLEGVLVGDIMTPEVETVHPETTAQEVLNLMFQKKHMGYPVMEDETLVGILTFHDISEIPPNMRNSPIKTYMTESIISTHPEEPVVDALEKLNRKQIGRLPVLSEGVLVGIISKTDIVRAIEIMNLKIGE
ncbi:CBS domain-containing protein [Methanobacterium aggregans]|uniref:CBS domain-containing protein n=1 Tax=Methanobacterium aggregans TaxID=1615586 RepID=UPI00247A0A89|nr:CBS domain-containing protein [Methanobacterium aggregans]